MGYESLRILASRIAFLIIVPFSVSYQFTNQITYKYDDGNNDYIYSAESLANLSGKKYHSKRNHITNFKKNNPDWCFEEISKDNIDECINLHTNWIEERDDNDSDYSLEFESVLTGFENYEKLGFYGGIIRVNGKAIAYTYGEKLNDECFVSHFEKAPADVQGAYAIINQDFLIKVSSILIEKKIWDLRD